MRLAERTVERRWAMMRVVRQVKTVRDTVSSLRLDAVAASAFGLSRGRAAELIAAGRVNLDHAACLKPDPQRRCSPAPL